MITSLPKLPRQSTAMAPAFSLVELLVVISIVSVLMALSLPALNTSREAARTAICASNLRQQFLLVGAYVQDQRDSALPITCRWSASWMVRMTPYLGWPLKSEYADIMDARYTLDGKLSGWASDAQCPDRKYPIFSCPTTKSFARPGYWGQCYGYNLVLTSGREDLSGGTRAAQWANRRTMNTIKWQPSNIVLTADCYINAFIGFGDFVGNLGETTGPRVHQNIKINMQFLDGHVALNGRGERPDINYLDAPGTGW